ncbi:SWIM zinc finger family protein [Candidatus Amarolinea dominans]|uniref:SWIM zinc finger family protein n=1 Tax=Candidatus Amarolinea dominans TaxID=3140696 RepID=UPI001DCB91E9|nr:SWIM zinc finger family protein [Anaerolineae bacterium]
MQGSRPTPYKITINIGQLTNQEWERVLTALAAQAIFTASLLNGEMPPDVETAFDAAKVSLFPQTQQDLTTKCSCPDAANPCKHLAAVFYLLGERFDQDPFLIFRLRGRTREEILGALRAGRQGYGAERQGYGAAAAIGAAAEKLTDGRPLEELIPTFWQEGAPLEHFTVSIAAPEVGAVLLKRLGAPPLGQDATEVSATLTRTYAIVTSQALDLAFGDEEEDEPAAA